MNARLVNSAAGVVQAAMEQGRRTATGIAVALESAQLLMTPEIAAELERLRARVAELETQRKADHETWQHDLRTARSEREATAARIAGLESERHSTNEALDDAVQALRAKHDEPAPMYVSRPLPPRDAVCARPGCGHSGEDHHHGDTKCWANLPRTRQRNGAWSAVPVCVCEGFVAEVASDGITRRIAPTQALREDPHDGPLAHRYLVPRDLPEIGSR